jgi:hypothetical protein
MTARRLYSTRQAADALGMDEGYIRRLAVKHGIGQKLGGGSWVFAARDLDRLGTHRWQPGKPGRPPTGARPASPEDGR